MEAGSRAGSLSAAMMLSYRLREASQPGIDGSHRPEMLSPLDRCGYFSGLPRRCRKKDEGASSRASVPRWDGGHGHSWRHYITLRPVLEFFRSDGRKAQGGIRGDEAVRMNRPIALASLLAVLGLLLAACSANRGLPDEAGHYDIVKGSVSFDGEKYELLWLDRGGRAHLASGPDFRLVQDERNFLEVGEDSPIIHLREDEPVAVRGQDSRGDFTSFWFPFMLGQVLSSPGPVISQPAPGTTYNPPPRTPSYRYPPTDTFGRDDTLHGSVTNDRPVPPDYGRVRPAPYAVSGQSGGTGSGTAATNKMAAPASGQSGGTGPGTAATSKGGFKSGAFSYAEKSGSITNKGGTVSGGSKSSIFSGSQSSKPSKGILGAKSSGGFLGKSAGGRAGVRVGGRR